ncbi:HIT family protein [Bacillus niameyensis]|uniref:HIT family protein n=1 Tax=Bacillus niameyensis TaxID=1522308 RepID=UPI000782F79F|nr:HIT family protein [Bacillus niameyensis]
MSNCIFCKIVNGELPSAKVFENDDVLAFLDLSQVTKGHTLVIPKAHANDIFQLTPEAAAKLFAVVPEISTALKTTYEAKGLNLINNNGSFAGQEVFHYHLHLIPRYDKTDGIKVTYTNHQKDYSGEDLQTIASTIRKQF